VTPFFFGTGPRRLFGIYDAASATGGASRRAVILCYPWGAEYIHAHRSLRQLAGRLSLAGFHALRFDYFGTGDSAGDMTDADLAGWEDDIESAIAELQDSTGAKRVVLVGLRLGATLAASVAARRRTDIDALVLWDPIVSGKSYLQDLTNGSTGEAPIARPDEAGGGHEVFGFPLTARMAQEFKMRDLTSQIAALPANTLIVVSERLPWHETLRRAVDELHGTSPTIEYLDDPQAWIERPDHPGILPTNVLNRIVHWLQQ
jgi:pimeloyl-ACP methyl ester carboxylesterase